MPQRAAAARWHCCTASTTPGCCRRASSHRRCWARPSCSSEAPHHRRQVTAPHTPTLPLSSSPSPSPPLAMLTMATLATGMLMLSSMGAFLIGTALHHSAGSSSPAISHCLVSALLLLWFKLSRVYLPNPNPRPNPNPNPNPSPNPDPRPNPDPSPNPNPNPNPYPNPHPNQVQAQPRLLPPRRRPRRAPRAEPPHRPPRPQPRARCLGLLSPALPHLPVGRGARTPVRRRRRHGTLPAAGARGAHARLSAEPRLRRGEAARDLRALR